MENKQVLQIESPVNDQFATINRSYCSFVDDRFYEKIMKENKDSTVFKNYPVKMTALRADWLMQD
jgi:hypothetical protein